ncbi:endonuclease VIII [Alkaliphilus peptidifermentans]|uniref:Formamidopyrimidine-DNA glycosylase n=1 Tax=Alkaliphilus peptidifermentans DSM 18978 TaxID=1120976 RepID=A0A1G5HAN6_9FIRM|nr:endonuclease VIII [Alkaliphilus peptidifermentans]SCY60833.1 formamidopyrimidine-DNA glycosylase [Alkaliphilus peptidifermentans DSM 18978]
MLELPEAVTIANQINDIIVGKKISSTIADKHPHKFAFYHGNPHDYHSLFAGKIVDGAKSYGGLVEIRVEKAVLLIGDGVGLRFHHEGAVRPVKHQLLIEFQDCTALSASIQMYGGIWGFVDGESDNVYYKIAKERPSPLSMQFDRQYFNKMISEPKVQKQSVKAFLATEQRIPGLGNGTLQDILYNAKIHPKRKINDLSCIDRDDLFNSIKGILLEMTNLGGRNTEKDLFGCPGGYKTKLSKHTLDKPCAVCGKSMKKESYLGGSIYYCEGCQPL